MGWRNHLRLLRLERLAWRAGLSYPVEDAGQRVPWHLPARFGVMGVAALPDHPLIDPGWLGGLCQQQGSGLPPSALEALHTLLAANSLPPRWHGMHTAPPARWTPTHSDTPAGAAAPRVAVCLHVFYPELLPEIQGQLAMLPTGWQLLVTVPDFACTPRLRAGLALHPHVRVFPLPNRGRDVWPWLELLAAGVFDDCDWVCKLHSKKSAHAASGQTWRQQIIDSLAGSSDNVQDLLKALTADPLVGLVGPAQYLKVAGDPQWGHQSDRAASLLARRLRLPPVPGGGTEWPYFAGTMFWFKPAALRLLADAGLQAKDFAAEMGQLDGTPAHAMERIVTRAVRAAGFATARWDARARRLDTVDWPAGVR